MGSARRGAQKSRGCGMGGEASADEGEHATHEHLYRRETMRRVVVRKV